MIFDQSNFLQSVGWAALNSLWQMALLWLVFQFINSLIKLRPTIKSSIASIFLLTGFAWFFYTFILAFQNAGDALLFSSGIFNLQGDSTISSWLQQSLPVASIIYLSLLLFPILRFVKNYRYVQIIRRYGLSKINIDTRIYINKSAIHLGIKRKVQIWISELVSSPVTIGFLKPIILVPIAAINHLTPHQLEAVLLHELAHIKRSDYLINLIINIIHTILYFNPFVKAFIKITETEREKSCDELVLQFQYNSHDYASALLELEKVNHRLRFFALAASGNKNDLLHRIENILKVKKKNTINLRKVSGFLFTICLLISINIAFLFTQRFSATSTTNNFSLLGVPKYLFDENKQERDKIAVPIAASIDFTTSVTSFPSGHEENMQNNSVEKFISTTPPSEFLNVSLIQPPDRVLKQYQEEQIKSALEASKKVLENSQWENAEQNIADVLTTREKEELKIGYQHQIENIDWSKWENRLRTTYDNINWDKVNGDLKNAINSIKIDSLQKVYTNSVIKLNEVQKELAFNKLKAIPDTDITLEKIAEKKELLQQLLIQLKAVKTKKIVHL